MRIAVVGAVCYDEIFPVEGPPRRGFGGILYNVAALSSVLNDDSAVVPCSKLGADRYDAAVAEFAKLPRVDMVGLTRVPDPFIHVTLEWRTQSWRDETVRNRMPPFNAAELEPALTCDALHINFIHGTEIDLPTLRAFRKRFKGLISLDVHNIISQWSDAGKRTIVGFRQWRDWAPFVDTVQCNEFEVDALFDHDVKTREDMAAAAAAICRAGPRAATVTLGPEGAVMVHRRGSEHFLVDIGVLPPVKAVDATGCGDSFSAGFVIGMLTHDDPATALACASVVAGVNARYTGLGMLAEAREYLERPRSHFAVFDGKPEDWPGEPV